MENACFACEEAVLIKENRKLNIAALAITAGLLGLIFYKINWLQLVETFKDFNFKNMPYIVPLYISTLYIRGIRWKSLLLNDKKYSSLHLGEVFTVGSMLNIFLPARAGDVYRAYYLGSVKGERKMKVFGSVILERILDGICVFFILLAAVLLYCRQQWILNLSYGIGALFIGSLILFYAVYKNIDWICAKTEVSKTSWFSNILTAFFAQAKSFADGFEVTDNFKYFSISIVTSFLIWGIECYVAYLIVDSFNLGLRLAAGLFVISLISFSTIIPSASVFLGPYQYAYILALGIFGVDKSSALAVSTVHQAILMLILTVTGGYYFLKFNLHVKKISCNNANYP
ncbi:MAG: flippase-like domain-containing protein [Heliobacteriaceae bacterium]|jgi:uncharacterized protein (TIRG00374 family)|nr:flippase-like domain-containing protein [Heliobacteriaceae bacterium]